MSAVVGSRKTSPPKTMPSFGIDSLTDDSTIWSRIPGLPIA